MNSFLSSKIRFFSFFLMILVVLLHSQNVSNRFPSFTNASFYNTFIQYFVSGGICQIAVPGFFLISGYLYFMGGKFTLKKYTDKTLKRIKTLFIPFIFTTLIVFSFFWALQQFSFSNKLINNKVNFNEGLFGNFLLVFTSSPSYQLWFIKDLMAICLLLPQVIYGMVKLFNGCLVLCIVFVWVCFSKQISSSFCPAITFFSLGAYLSYYANDLNVVISKRVLLTIILLWLTFIILSFFTSFSFDILINTSILLGLICTWIGYDFLFRSISFSSEILSLSFFLYLFHEPFLTFVIKLFFFKFGINNSTSFWAFIFSPLVTVLVVLTIGHILRKHLTVVYNFLTGSR